MMTLRVPAIRPLFLCAFAFFLAACEQEQSARPAAATEPAPTVSAAPVLRTNVDDAALSDESNGENWLAYGRTYSEKRFSPLSAIHDGNVTQLGVAWFVELPRARSLPGTPLVVDGVMYFEEFYNVVHAVDATTGEQLWEYDPGVIEHAGPRLRVMWDYSRGLAFWQGKVYSATIDGRLIAIDAQSGRELWSVMTLDPDKQGQGDHREWRHGDDRRARLRDRIRR